MKGGDDMKKKILLIFLVLLVPAIVSGQNKVEACLERRGQVGFI